MPEPEGEDIEDFYGEEIEEVEDDAYWLVPGTMPEPYWDTNMGQEFNFSQLKYYLNKALRVTLTPREMEYVLKAFKND